MKLKCGPILPVILTLLLTACVTEPSKPTALTVAGNPCETLNVVDYTKRPGFEKQLNGELAQLTPTDPIRITEDDYHILRTDIKDCVKIGKSNASR